VTSRELFNRAIEVVIEHEGDTYTDNPLDRGGPTKFGIAQRWNPDLDVKSLTRAQAIEVYWERYWHGHRYEFLPEVIAIKVFDLAVNLGHKTVVTCLQRALHACGLRVTIDGLLGTETCGAAMEGRPNGSHGGAAVGSGRRIPAPGRSQRRSGCVPGRLAEPCLCLKGVEMIGEILGILGKIAGTVAERIFPNPEHELKRLELQQALQAAVLERTAEIEKAAAEVVKAEAQGQSWLQRTWRPITMLTFVALIVARWLGWSAPNLAEAEALKLWDIVEIGLGGYVIGRSAEKVLPVLVETMKKN